MKKGGKLEFHLLRQLFLFRIFTFSLFPFFTVPDGVAFQIFETDDGQGGFVRRIEINPRSHIRVQGLAPAQHAEAPLVAVLDTGESVLRHRRRQIVARRLGERQKFVRRLDADRVPAGVVDARAAVTVAVKSRHWVRAAAFQLTAKYILGLRRVAITVSVCVTHINSVAAEITEVTETNE